MVLAVLDLCCISSCSIYVLRDTTSRSRKKWLTHVLTLLPYWALGPLQSFDQFHAVHILLLSFGPVQICIHVWLRRKTRTTPEIQAIQLRHMGFSDWGGCSLPFTG
jgi:hypothetical protein